MGEQHVEQQQLGQQHHLGRGLPYRHAPSLEASRTRLPRLGLRHGLSSDPLAPSWLPGTALGRLREPWLHRPFGGMWHRAPRLPACPAAPCPADRVVWPTPLCRRAAHTLQPRQLEAQPTSRRRHRLKDDGPLGRSRGCLRVCRHRAAQQQPQGTGGGNVDARAQPRPPCRRPSIKRRPGVHSPCRNVTTSEPTN